MKDRDSKKKKKKWARKPGEENALPAHHDCQQQQEPGQDPYSGVWCELLEPVTEGQLVVD